MTELRIKNLKANYLVPEGYPEEKSRLDLILKSRVLVELPRILEERGIASESECCIRHLRVPARLSLLESDEPVAEEWNSSLEKEVGRMIDTGSADLVHYPSRTHALIRSAEEIAGGDLGDAWAWNSLGLGRFREEMPGREAMGALLDRLHLEHTGIMPLLRYAARRNFFHRFFVKREPAFWSLLSRCAMGNAGGRWTRAGEKPASYPNGHALFMRVMMRSEIMRAFFTSFPGCLCDEDLACAAAILSLLEVEPGLAEMGPPRMRAAVGAVSHGIKSACAGAEHLRAARGDALGAHIPEAPGIPGQGGGEQKNAGDKKRGADGGSGNGNAPGGYHDEHGISGDRDIKNGGDGTDPWSGNKGMGGGGTTASNGAAGFGKETEAALNPGAGGMAGFAGTEFGNLGGDDPGGMEEGSSKVINAGGVEIGGREEGAVVETVSGNPGKRGFSDAESGGFRDKSFGDTVSGIPGEKSHGHKESGRPGEENFDDRGFGRPGEQSYADNESGNPGMKSHVEEEAGSPGEKSSGGKDFGSSGGKTVDDMKSGSSGGKSYGVTDFRNFGNENTGGTELGGKRENVSATMSLRNTGQKGLGGNKSTGQSGKGDLNAVYQRDMGAGSKGAELDSPALNSPAAGDSINRRSPAEENGLRFGADGRGSLEQVEIPVDAPGEAGEQGVAFAGNDARLDNIFPSPFDRPGREATTEWAGLLFFLFAMRRSGVVGDMTRDPRFERYGMNWLLYRLGLSILPSDRDDPVLLVFSGLAPFGKPLGAGEPGMNQGPPLDIVSPLPADVEEKITGWRNRLLEMIRRLISEELPPDDPLIHKVCRRKAQIIADPGWIEVHMSHEDVSVDIRRGGLDLDPGYVPWIGAVIKFYYS